MNTASIHERPVMCMVTGSDTGGGGTPPPVTLDPEEDKSPTGIRTEYKVVPVYSGGALDHEGGARHRFAYLKKFEALASEIRMPAFITLTIDRKRFPNPKAAHEYASRLVSKFLSERMGISVWGRVMEVQTATGDGWVHWHGVAELGGTQWETRKGWVDLKGFSTRAWEVWRDEFGIGGVNVQRAKSRDGIAGYMAGYLTKGWPAVPRWMLPMRKRFRIVGFSSAANEIIRRVLNLPPKPPSRKTGRKCRQCRTVLDRLAASGLFSKIIQTRTAPDGSVTKRYVGVLPVVAHELLFIGTESLGIAAHSVERNGRPRLEIRLEWDPAQERARLAELAAAAERAGLVESSRDRFHARRSRFLDAWDEMQHARERG